MDSEGTAARNRQKECKSSPEGMTDGQKNAHSSPSQCGVRLLACYVPENAFGNNHNFDHPVEGFGSPAILFDHVELNPCEIGKSAASIQTHPLIVFPTHRIELSSRIVSVAGPSRYAFLKR
jgi:hypothetical protein